MEIKEHSFNTGLVTINYAQGPASGRPLVLLHGGSARWQNSASIMPDLAADWRLYAPEFRGHGKSGRVAGAYRLQDYADDTIAFLRQRVCEPAAIYGHSLGGMVALLVAAQCPDLVRAVVVGDAPLTAETWIAHIHRSRDAVIIWRDLAGGACSVEEITEALESAWLAQNLYHNDADMLTIVIEEPDRAAAGYDMAVVLPSIRCPVLLLQADPQAGGLMTDAEIEQGLRLLSQATHVLIEGASHRLHNEQKGPVLRAIRDFLTANLSLAAL